MNQALFGSLPSSACTLGTEGTFGPDRISETVYDAVGRPTQLKVAVGTTDAANERTLSYTANGMLATLTDAENNKTTYEYDGFDRLTRTLFPMPTKGANASNPNDDELLAYDAASNVTGFTNRAGQTIGFTYDALNRPTLKNMPATSAGDVTYTYDLLGRLLTAKFGTGRGITNSFNSVGEMLSTATDMSGTARTLSYQYDVAGRRTRVTHPDGQFFTYQFDTLDRPTGILEGATTSLVTIAYDDLGRRTSLSRTGAGTTSYTYDPVSRLASLTQNLAGSASDLVIDQIAYNPASQIVGQRRSPDAYAWTGHTNGTIDTTANGLNQIATKDATAYTYDANGNLISDGTWTYNYDTENRLKDADSAAGGVNLFYDPLGRLWQVSGEPVVDMQFVNDGIDLALEYRISSGAVERRYVHGTGWDEPLVQYDGATLATKRHLHADERGSIVSLTDATGANPAINRYDEYGMPQSTNSGRFGYTGQVWLKEIGLNYYKTRMYRPGDGVFLQPDPIGYRGGMNLYAYVGNDPVNFTDPLGLCRRWRVTVWQDLNGNGRREGNEPVTSVGYVDDGNCGAGFLPQIPTGGWPAPPPLLDRRNVKPQERQSPTPCQAAFLKSQLASRGMPTD